MDCLPDLFAYLNPGHPLRKSQNSTYEKPSLLHYSSEWRVLLNSLSQAKNLRVSLDYSHSLTPHIQTYQQILSVLCSKYTQIWSSLTISIILSPVRVMINSLLNEGCSPLISPLLLLPCKGKWAFHNTGHLEAKTVKATWFSFLHHYPPDKYGRTNAEFGPRTKKAWRTVFCRV